MLGLQTIVSRQADLTTAPAIVTIGVIQGGNRSNIIPDDVTMEGTIRTFDPAMQQQIHERIRRTATKIAEAAGATAEVAITDGNPVTYNDPALAEHMAPTLERVAAAEFNANAPVNTTSEDFALYLQKVPGLMIHLGVSPKGFDPLTVEPNHSPRFFVDEGALVTGVRALCSLAVDYLADQRGAGTAPAK